MATMKNSGKLPNPTDVLNGKIKKLDSSVEISGRYSLTVSMCYELREAYEKEGTKGIEKFHKLADNFFRFMMDNFETEMVVLGARAALVTYKIPLRPKYLKNYKEFYDRFGKYIKASHNA
jgi:serine protease inhibitor